MLQCVLSIQNEQLVAFQERVGFRLCSHKQQRLAVAAARGRTALKDECSAGDIDADRLLEGFPTWTTTFVGWRHAGLREVYDISVPTTENFLAAGITVHNCASVICKVYHPGKFKYRCLWLLDSREEDVSCLFYDVLDFIESAREENGRVFIHCQQGVSRSSAMTIAYIMWRTGKGYAETHSEVKKKRNVSNPNAGFVVQVRMMVVPSKSRRLTSFYPSL